MGKFTARVFFDIFIKVGLLALGLADFLGVLPSSLDLFDKVLTTLILAAFWYALKPSKFIFGKRKKFLDISILVAFYVLVIDTFVTLVRVIELGDPFMIKTNAVFSFLPNFIYTPIKSLFLFVHNPVNATIISQFSIYIGFALLLGIALYSAFNMTYGKKSVMHSFARLFMRSEKSWKDFSDTKGASRIIKFLISFIVLLAIYQYFFSLINQWFVVSLDKALLVLAILYAAKDFHSTKSKVFNKLGEFDEWLLKFITNTFTNEKKFFFGFGILLIFHFLSDLATFFLPYISGFMKIDPFYLNYLGDTAGALHQPIIALIAQESAASVFQTIITSLTYIFSTIGVLFLIILPIILLYTFITNVNMNNLLKQRFVEEGIVFFFFSSLLFLLAPWVKQKIISVSGIQGVDFITTTISSSLSINWLFFGFLGLLIVSLIFVLKLHYERPMLTLLFMGSLMYFGLYIWNYFASSTIYHFQAISFFFAEGQIIGAIIFVILFLLEFLFYVGGFVYLAYHIVSYLVSHVIVKLFNNAGVLFWNFFILILPIILMFQTTLNSLKVASVAILLLVIFAVALYKEHAKKERRDDYLLAVTIAIGSYQSVLIVNLLLLRLSIISQEIFNFVQPIVIGLVALLVTRFFAQKYCRVWPSVKKIVFTLLLGLGFGVVFFALGEPLPFLFSSSFVVLLFFTLFVAFSEELLFRGIIYGLAQQAFSKKLALHLQALVFSIIHFTGLLFLFNHFTGNGAYVGPGVITMLLYFAGLYFFSLVAAKMVKCDARKLNLIRPILFHWVVNLVAFLLLAL